MIRSLALWKLCNELMPFVSVNQVLWGRPYVFNLSSSLQSVRADSWVPFMMAMMLLVTDFLLEKKPSSRIKICATNRFYHIARISSSALISRTSVWSMCAKTQVGLFGSVNKGG